MSAQHTPGPWKFGKELTARSGEWLVSFDAGSKGRGIAIAETRAGSGNEEFDARLIAAAPDLLNSLREAMSAVEVFHGPIAWDIFRDHAPEMKRWLAAIAKATGGQP